MKRLSAHQNGTLNVASSARTGLYDALAPDVCFGGNKGGNPWLTDKSEVCSPKFPLHIVFFLGQPFLEEKRYGAHTPSL